MKIRYLTGLAGAYVRHRGDVAEVDDAEAARLFAAGYAEPLVKAAAARERAVNPAAAARETRRKAAQPSAADLDAVAAEAKAAEATREPTDTSATSAVETPGQ